MMDKKLTRRQQQFLSQFLGIYQEMKSPLHYGAVAERLEIGKVTAYEMLRLLEEYGLVSAEYEFESKQHGPGRPVVLFFPTEEGQRLVNHLAGEPADVKDWEAIKERILQQLREARAEGYEALLGDFLVHIPEHRSPLIFVTELITAFLLSVSALPKSPELIALMAKLQRIGLPGEIGLNTLSGITLAISMLERINRRFAALIQAQTSKFETVLAQMSEDNRKRVGDFTREAVKILSN